MIPQFLFFTTIYMMNCILSFIECIIVGDIKTPYFTIKDFQLPKYHHSSKFDIIGLVLSSTRCYFLSSLDLAKMDSFGMTSTSLHTTIGGCVCQENGKKMLSGSAIGWIPVISGSDISNNVPYFL